MKIRGDLFVVLVVMGVTTVWGADATIRLNSLGFLPDSGKKATIVTNCSTFTVKQSETEKIVFSGQVTGPQQQEDVNQVASLADFSEVTTPGRYYLDVPGAGRSIEFMIGDTVYREAFVTAMRGFYLWRCGTAVEGVHQGHRYTHAACHLQDGFQNYMGIDSNDLRDGTGGWHDAGDYGKYTVNAGITVGCLFMAWDHFQDTLKGIDLDLPDTAPGYPDFLQEIKWETDWLLKMQYPDGSGRVSHKLTRLNFSGFVMPSTDKEKRYFTDWGSTATADFVAVMAMAARYFKPFDPAYAQTCLDAAKTSYAFLKANPDYKRWRQREFSTGGYQSLDDDDRLWAAAEMWETTGDPECLQDFETRAAESTTSRGGRRRQQATHKVDVDWDWGNVRNLGMFTYALSEREGRNVTLLDTIRSDILSSANTIVDNTQNDVYGRPLVRYYWGCNGTVARQVLNLQVAHRIKPDPNYREAALDAIAHLFGRNVYNRSYVTGLGLNPPMHPHDRRSAADDIADPWPGYLVGGGNPSATDWHDVQEDYRTNEIAINWQAGLVYALAGFIGP